ncbi:arachidonate 15-lipoxygenase B-like isoform X1 [Cynoglossus semilaevis]|uniref:arachidonate 15-lipoxygenase B-like isoform X1 n=1 Tax=Cynoglossus semilaevis TaxID=244447 RepID=UPI000D630187|nr:arachidonate 15-lipoxygenase B-like isoform X1 [Cynoglossus semilaevis]
MSKYQVKVFTSERALPASFNQVFIKLVGENGESSHTMLKNLLQPLPFLQGSVVTFNVSCSSLGKLILIELDKKPLPLTPSNAWLPAKVEVVSPEGDTYSFPIYRWINDKEVHRFRAAEALKVSDDNHHLGRYDREKELKFRAEEYCWSEYAAGIPHCIKTENALSLPPEVQFSFTKKSEFFLTSAFGLSSLGLTLLSISKEPWTDFKSIKESITKNKTAVSEYVQKHWEEDEFFAYQFLNGVNPILIRKCTVLPDNFPVPDNVVLPQSKNSLRKEMKKGNIYLCDYKNLKDVKANIINGKQQYLTAPLVLLYKTPNDKLMPVAIQLNQEPGADNPIFYPNDSKYDWLTAKTFVRSADFSEHQLNVHLLRTHLLAEVFAVSLLRNFPMVHPLYKVTINLKDVSVHGNIVNFSCVNNSIPVSLSSSFPTHATTYRSTTWLDFYSFLQLEFSLRYGNVYFPFFPYKFLNLFLKFSASGGDAMMPILQRSLKSVTYSSLCVPDSIAERGMGKIPNYYYRDDALRLWDITLKFVDGVVKYYYKSDSDVKKDSELQNWIGDIFEHGFLSNEASGIPRQFTKVVDLVKFVTMVIFTGSFQHAAVNSGQYDFGAWMPNTPISLQYPPPTTKGKTSEDTLVATLPDRNTTALGISTVWLLSRQSSDVVKVGQYPEDHFVEKVPRKLMAQFKGELDIVNKIMEVRNRNLKLKYEYLQPELVENSVAI